MKRDEILKQISDFLHDRLQMVVATSGEHPWIATVYYALDSDLNFYFISDPQTLHGSHIASNPHIALSVSDSPQHPSSKKKGIQIYGIATQLKDEKEITFGLELWRKKLEVTSDAYTYEGIMKNEIHGRLYKITPKKIKYYNEEIWDEGDEKTITL